MSTIPAGVVAQLLSHGLKESEVRLMSRSEAIEGTRSGHRRPEHVRGRYARGGPTTARLPVDGSLRKVHLLPYPTVDAFT
jgi:hypothetical protein